MTALTNDEAELIKWCLMTEVGRCERFLMAEAFDGKEFRVNYEKRMRAAMSAAKKIDFVINENDELLTGLRDLRHGLFFGDDMAGTVNALLDRLIVLATKE